MLDDEPKGLLFFPRKYFVFSLTVLLALSLFFYFVERYPFLLLLLFFFRHLLFGRFRLVRHHSLLLPLLLQFFSLSLSFNNT